jgi:hypothetical protein
LKKKGFKEERVIKVGVYAIVTSMTLESNKSHPVYVAFGVALQSCA